MTRNPGPGRGFFFGGPARGPGRSGARHGPRHPVMLPPMNTHAGPTFRTSFLLGFLACAGLIGFALFSQFQWGLEPCPLCIFQRVAFAALGVVFLLGALQAPRGRAGRVAWGVLALAAALAGIAVAGNHVRLQMLPADQVPACWPGLDYMMEMLPVTGVIQKVMTGSGECADVDWSFLGLSMPAWSLAWFLLLAAWAAWAACRRRCPSPRRALAPIAPPARGADDVRFPAAMEVAPDGQPRPRPAAREPGRRVDPGFVAHARGAAVAALPGSARARGGRGRTACVAAAGDILGDPGAAPAHRRSAGGPVLPAAGRRLCRSLRWLHP